MKADDQSGCSFNYSWESYLGVENSSYQLFGQLVQEGAVLESADGELGPTCLVTAHSAGPLWLKWTRNPGPCWHHWCTPTARRLTPSTGLPASQHTHSLLQVSTPSLCSHLSRSPNEGHNPHQDPWLILLWVNRALILIPWPKSHQNRRKLT